MYLYRHEVADVLNNFPEAIALERTYSAALPDVLLATLGFEERTSAVAGRLKRDEQLSSARLILVHYPTNTDDNERQAPAFDEIARGMRSRHDLVYSRATFAEDLRQALADIADGAHVLFDISTCSSYLFYPIMQALIERDIRLTITYGEAGTYYPALDEWREVNARAEAEEGQLFVHAFEDADFLSMGVDDVFPSNLFAERNPGNKPSTLVAMPNFNAIRMGAIIQRDRELNKTSPDDIFWLIGEPPANKNKWRADAILRTNRPQLNILPERIRHASTFDYKEIVRILEEIWLATRYSSHLSIGALGSKMQHLGVFLFIRLHPETGLWLAEPRVFKAGEYSKGVADLWGVQFGSTRGFRGTLAKYMKFTWDFESQTEPRTIDS